MVVLAVISLIIAILALVVAGYAVLRARAAAERAVQAASAVGRAEIASHAATAGVEQLEMQLARAHQDAAEAAQQAKRAAQAAEQASTAAVSGARAAEEAAHSAHSVVSFSPPTGAVPVADPETVAVDPAHASGGQGAASGVAVSGVESGARANVHRAEDHSVSSRTSGETERVVQVAWQLEHVRGSIWTLRNAGMVTAREAMLSEATLPPKYVRPDEVIPRDVARDDVLQFRVSAGRGAPPPRIRVTWREGSGSPAYSREFTVLSGS